MVSSNGVSATPMDSDTDVLVNGQVLSDSSLCGPNYMDTSLLRLIKQIGAVLGDNDEDTIDSTLPNGTTKLKNGSKLDVKQETPSTDYNGNADEVWRSKVSQEITTELLLGLVQECRQTILQLNLNKNLNELQAKMTTEQLHMENQILKKSLETFTESNGRLKAEINNLLNKKEKLVNYVRKLKTDKKHLKVELLRQSQQMNQIEEHVNVSRGDMLNTLGILASHVLEDEQRRDLDETIEV
ncbi:BA75_04924T0 [Komagataella pastoris]|uniref:BA75_04924T0 n=1 Tax=Komagataella pastoris TaxID=4922 RepID=A0A1B2JIY1_PICPA|nr:BA75_04924T0 [Komagataella pastoris]